MLSYIWKHKLMNYINHKNLNDLVNLHAHNLANYTITVQET